MMKFTCLCFTLFCALCSSAQFFKQNFLILDQVKIIATYSLHYMEDSTNQAHIRNSEMLLLLGNNVSQFESKGLYMSDTIIRKLMTQEQVQQFFMNPQSPMSSITYQIFKNYPNGKLTFTQPILGTNLKYEESLDIYKWKLTQETSTICGYKAKKATCNFGGRSWVAWFAPELPYSDGPYKFNGLPGLIVKIADTRNHYVFELLSIGKPNKSLPVDFLDDAYMVTTKQGFFKAQDDFRADIVNRAKAAGATNQMQQVAAKNMSERNNHIELIRK